MDGQAPGKPPTAWPVAGTVTISEPAARAAHVPTRPRVVDSICHSVAIRGRSPPTERRIPLDRSEWDQHRLHQSGLPELPAGYRRQPDHGRLYRRPTHQPDCLFGTILIQIASTAAGLISSLTDSAVGTVNYNYDASHTYLVSVNSFNGQTTNYSYVTTAGAAQNALQTITIAGGTHEYFSYDTQVCWPGFPRTAAHSRKRSPIPSGAHDDQRHGRCLAPLLQRKRPDRQKRRRLGHDTYYTHDANFNLTGVTNVAGHRRSTSTTRRGKSRRPPTSWGIRPISPMPARSIIVRDDDANGHTTQYQYNSSGDLLGTTYATVRTRPPRQSRRRGDLVRQPERPGDRLHVQRRRPDYATRLFGRLSYAYAYDSQGNCSRQPTEPERRRLRMIRLLNC